MINSVLRTGKIYYPQVFLEECKYVVKEKKISKYIIDDTEISSDSDKEILRKKILIKKIEKKKETNIIHILKLILKPIKLFFVYIKNAK